MNRAFDLYTEGPQDENYMEDVNDVVAYVQETVSYTYKTIQHLYYTYSGTSLIRTPMGQKKVSLLVRCPHFRVEMHARSGTWGGKRCPV